MRRTQRLRAHDDQGEAQGDRACERKDPPGNLRPDGIAFEVIRHGPPRQRRRDKEGDDHHQREILRDKIHEARYGSTEYLPDANLFDALLPGFLLHWDLPDALRALGKRRVIWTNPTDWMEREVALPSPYRYRTASDSDESFIAELVTQ